MRTRLGTAALAGLLLLVGAHAFARAPRDSNDANKPAATVAAGASDAGATAKPGDADAAPPSDEALPAPEPDPAPQGAAASAPAAGFNPIAATTGTLGLFTLETGQTLPKGGWSFSGSVNKLTLMPGSVSVLDIGVNVGFGITNRLSIYAAFDPYQHTHIGLPTELSLDTPSIGALATTYPEFGTTIYRQLGPTLRPGYVENFPFAGENGGGVGDVTVGVKYGLLSQDRGAPISLSLRNDFDIPTVTSLTDLLQNGTQTGTFNDEVALALSKNWGRIVTVTSNFGYLFTPDPTSGGVVMFHQADQFIPGVGFILFPGSRIQVMDETDGLVFVGRHTPDMTFGARDPVAGVWGVRFYVNNAIAVDAGYRYMLNLSNAVDRSGFIVKIGTTWIKEKPFVPINRSPVVACSVDKDSVFSGTGDAITITATASDPDGDPITYTWMASGGNVSGNGAQERWVFGNIAPGAYTATVRVDDGRGGNSTCTVDARVDPRPNRPPTVSLAPDRNPVLVGERVVFTATASDPDGDPLTYTWSTNGGQLSPGAAMNLRNLDTTGVTPGLYTVTVRVEDGRGGAADASAGVQVNAPPVVVPPQANRISGCDFTALNGARVDNVCKRVLDDVALRLKNDPRATVVIVGFADPRERRPDQLAGNRGTNAVKYLTAAPNGVDASRITTRTGAGQAGAGQANRRIDIIWVPEGATY
jgi:hypothetical protein